MKKVLVSLSGGMDSATCLGMAVSRGHKVSAVGFTYGSKHNEFENKMAAKLADHFEVPFQLIDITSIICHFKSNLLKSGGDIPEGHYEEESMKQTVVPGRNIIFASILSGLAMSEEFDQVWIGIHSGDHVIYPDCRPRFYEHMRDAVLYGTDGKVLLEAPFLHDNKTTIVRAGMTYGVPYELTRTCYKQQELSCGKCGACQERLEAFRNNGIPDPILYEES